MDRMINNNNSNFTDTTTSWNINLHGMPMNHHQDHHHPLDCIPMWPLAFPLQESQFLGHHNHREQDPDRQDQATDGHDDEEEEELGAMKEMMYKIAAMQPVDIDPAAVRRPRRRNVRISDDPQSVAARHRRERISEKMRILQRLVPGGTKMDTASMLDEAIRYVKFLKRQIRHLQSSNHHPPQPVFIGSVSGDSDWSGNIAPDKSTGSSSGRLIGHNISRSLSFNREVIN